VQCFWSHATAPGAESRVLPDGSVDILFDLSAPAGKPAALVVGTMTRPLLVSRSRSGDFLAARFRPGGAQPILGFSMSELTDGTVDLEAVWADARDWGERLAEARTTPDRLRLLEDLLSSRLDPTAAPEARVVGAVSRIERARGAVAVGALSREIGVSRQHLTRLFEHHVGVGVKFFARVVRFQAILKRLSRPESDAHHPNWAEVALDHGFFDQAHFGLDFKALTGLTPQTYLSSPPRPGTDRTEAARL
jgi:AraC-like DNA-binding protein